MTRHRRGTTSACAENTFQAPKARACWRNYLRMRGEYTSGTISAVSSMELPPHARRIRQEKDNGDSYYGTTSACAENTQLVSPVHLLKRNYLRMRGEYLACGAGHRWVPELPPHARRILVNAKEGCGHLGTTSACAENTGSGRV